MKFFKGKNKKLNVTPKEPRTIAAIQKEYGELVSKAGQLQYQIEIHKRDLANTNDQLVSVNREAAERIRLDKENLAKETKPETKTETKSQGVDNA